MSKQLVPLMELPAELPVELGPHSAIAWQLSLPPNIDQEQIGFDLAQAKGIAHMAGLGG